jgi:hypothetical protein
LPPGNSSNRVNPYRTHIRTDPARPGFNIYPEYILFTINNPVKNIVIKGEKIGMSLYDQRENIGALQFAGIMLARDRWPSCDSRVPRSDPLTEVPLTRKGTECV